MRDDEFVPIYTAKTAGEAEVVRLTLESAGVMASVAGKQFADLLGLFEFQVLVKFADRTRAIACLADDSTTEASGVAAEADDPSEDEGGSSPNDGAETPAILSRIRCAFQPRRRLPAWLRPLIE